MALIAVLEALDPPHPEAAAAGRRQLICVANTHIHANPELNDVKLWQARAAFIQGGVLLWRRLLCFVTDRNGSAHACNRTIQGALKTLLVLSSRQRPLYQCIPGVGRAARRCTRC